MTVQSQAADLLAWYDRAARCLPWRAPPGSAGRPDPYRVWLSEIMLQQTTVAAVIPYFERFLARWPTVGDLAAAPLEEVLAAWAGLGYYARARNLHACARSVAAEHGGRFPSSEAGLRALPGIGAYTAAAVAAIAFGARAAVVDGNVERVISRLLALETPLPAARPLIRAEVDQRTPADRPGDFAQAMMDLGATVCTPRNPGCGACPWASACAARAAGSQARYPLKAVRPGRPERWGHVFWLEADGQVLLRRRPPTGLLGGMVELPGSAWLAGLLPVPAAQDPDADAPAAVRWQRVPGQVVHVFTHFRLTLQPWQAVLPRPINPSEGFWHPVAALDRAGLPSVMVKVWHHVQAARQGVLAPD